MVDFAKQYAGNVYSQNGEDFIIKEVLRRIKLKKIVAVEFGAADGFFFSNTANIKCKRFLYDVDSVNPDVIEKEITPDNVNELPGCDMLSIDIDGNDYEVWKAYEGRPAIVIIEINSDFDSGHFLIHGVHHNKGTTYTPMVQLGLHKGYFLLCHTGNLIFILNKYRKLFPEIEGNGLTNADKYFNTAWLHS